jgi:acyl-CoA thioester hydrolase
MSIAQAESLKRELTDKYVVVQEGVAELRRFTGLTGQIRTVNMNGRALVQFDGPVDISWYDIDPAFLKVVAAPQPKAAAKHAEKAAAPKAEAAKPAPAAGKSPLELARAQGAGAKPAAPAGEGKKLSPLELARQQGAGGAAAAPAGEKKLSPLEQARQQGASKPAAPRRRGSDASSTCARSGRRPRARRQVRSRDARQYGRDHRARPSAGRLQGLAVSDWHETEIRVRYSETDAMGLLHHANYISYFEIARTELFRAQGGDYRAMEERGYYLVVVSVACQYKRPARYDDVLAIRASLVKWTGAKLQHEYEVRRGGELVAVGQSVLACVDQHGDVQRLTSEVLYGRPDGP